LTIQIAWTHFDEFCQHYRLRGLAILIMFAYYSINLQISRTYYICIYANLLDTMNFLQMYIQYVIEKYLMWDAQWKLACLWWYICEDTQAYLLKDEGKSELDMVSYFIEVHSGNFVIRYKHSVTTLNTIKDKYRFTSFNKFEISTYKK